VVLGILNSLALAGRREMFCPLGMLGTPEILLALDGFGLVFFGVCQRDLHPFWAILLLPSALLGPVPVLALLAFLLLWFLLFLLQLLDLGFQGKDLFFFWGWCIPSVGLFEGFELVVHQKHEGIGVDFHPFFVLILLFADVRDELLVS